MYIHTYVMCLVYPQRISHTLHTAHMYMYVRMCVCMCVCVHCSKHNNELCYTYSMDCNRKDNTV